MQLNKVIFNYFLTSVNVNSSMVIENISRSRKSITSQLKKNMETKPKDNKNEYKFHIIRQKNSSNKINKENYNESEAPISQRNKINSSINSSKKVSFLSQAFDNSIISINSFGANDKRLNQIDGIFLLLKF